MSERRGDRHGERLLGDMFPRPWRRILLIIDRRASLPRVSPINLSRVPERGDYLPARIETGV